MKRILVLEDEFFLLDSMTKYLRGLPDVRVYGYSNLKTACKGLREHPPDLIFSDIRLPDGSGLRLVDELVSLNLAVPLVFISAYAEEHRNRIPDRQNITILEKPLSLKRLRDIAQEKLAEPQTTGEFFFKLSDYLQIAAMGRHSVRVNCADVGTIEVFEGHPWHAEDAEGEGLDAFKRIVANCETGSSPVKITCTYLDAADSDEPTLSGSLDGLLLDAVREVDETERDQPEIFDDTSDFERLYERGVELMLAKQYQAAYDAFSQAHRIDTEHRLVRTNLDRLAQLIQNAKNKPETELP